MASTWKKYLVAICTTDGSGYRLGIVNARSHKEARKFLGSTIIGHRDPEDFDWAAFVDDFEPPQREPDWFKPVKVTEAISTEVLVRDDGPYMRWLLTAEIKPMESASVLATYDQDTHLPVVYVRDIKFDAKTSLDRELHHIEYFPVTDGDIPFGVVCS